MASISSTSSAAQALTSQKGIGGLATGLDTDELVRSLTSTERNKIDKQEQEIQKLQWKQEAYRNIITKMQEFQSKYLDILSKTNLRSASNFNTIMAIVSSNAVSVSTNSESYAGNFVIDYVSQLATGKSIKATGVSADLTGKADLSTPEALADTVESLKGNSLSITVDGTVKTITFDKEWENELYKDENGEPLEAPTQESFTRALQSKLDKAFGAGRVTASITDGGNLKFDTNAGSTISIDAVAGQKESLAALGFESKQSNKISMNRQLSEITGAFKNAMTTTNTRTEDVKDSDGNVTGQNTIGTYKFTINDVEFEFDDTRSLSSIISEINSSKAGVTISYSDIDDSFTITSKTTGQASDIVLKDDESSNFLAALGLTGNGMSESGVNTVVTDGQNAIFSVNGQEVQRESNANISVSGVRLTLNEVTSEAITVTMSEDTTDLKDMIVQFVNDYNEMIEMLNKARTEKADRDYAPLTEDQKADMSDKEIEKWEEKAKAGVLRNDSTLNTLSSRFSALMYTSFNGFSLYEMGIQSAGYTENGKLTIDEDKLDKALSENSEKIKSFFTGDSGFGNALKEVVDGAIKTSGPQGSRGSLIEKAGIGNTMSDTENVISEKIKDLQKFIETLKTRLESRESYWWKKFSALETLASRMNSYSSMIDGFGMMG